MSRTVFRPRLTLALGGLALAALLTPSAAAQRDRGIEVGITKRIGDAHIGITVGNGGVGVHAGVRGRRPEPTWRPAPPPPPSGRWETRVERVWVPGPVRQVWVPPLYETRRDPCGRLYQVEVRCGYWDTIQEPGYWEQRETRVWVPCPPAHHEHRPRRVRFERDDD